MSSRIEIFLKAIKEGKSKNLPIPQSRLEKLLYAIATGNDSNIETPASRVEEYLYYILKNGGMSGENGSVGVFQSAKIEETLRFENSIINSLTLSDTINIEVVEANE